MKFAQIFDTYPEHQVFSGQIIGYVDTEEPSSYKLIQSYNSAAKDYFPVNANKLRVFFPRWTSVAYRHLGEGELVQENRYSNTPISEGFLMSSFKGTPGPWVVDPLGILTRWNIDTMDGTPVAITNPLAGDKNWEGRDANTRLIAAAPELLEALQDLRKAWLNGSAHDITAAEIKADFAIKKAIGDEND
ncbi:VirE domain protein [Salmonella phage 40]|nr:VirE domain protein [Salmonella phage 40]